MRRVDNREQHTHKIYIFIYKIYILVGCIVQSLGFPGGSAVKNSPAVQETGDTGLIPSQEDSLEEGMATRSRILAWRIPWTVEAVGLQSMGLHSRT